MISSEALDRKCFLWYSGVCLLNDRGVEQSGSSSGP